MNNTIETMTKLLKLISPEKIYNLKATRARMKEAGNPILCGALASLYSTPHDGGL